MKRAVKLLKASMIAVVVLCSCQSSDEPEIVDTPRAEIPLSRSQKELVDNESRFAFDFLKAVNVKQTIDGDANLIISPLSMARDLSMLLCGATDETRQSLLKVLHLQDDCSIDELNNINNTMLKALLSADNKVTLEVANSFWYGKDFPVKDSYINTLKTNYNAKSTEIDFGASDAYEIINGWCAQSTHGMIKEIISMMDLAFHPHFILLDAVYFKGNWAYVIDPENTRDMAFYNNDSIPTNVSTMTTSCYTMVGGDEKVTVLAMPYGNKAYSMYFVMADEGNDINDVISELDFDKWTALKRGMFEKNIEVSIPKFDIDYYPILTEVFESLGLICENPNLPYISDRSSELIDIKQHSAIKVDETGAKAAATSAVIVGDGAYFDRTEIENVNINRPFVFLIEEYSTNAILFAGKVVKL